MNDYYSITFRDLCSGIYSQCTWLLRLRLPIISMAGTIPRDWKLYSFNLQTKAIQNTRNASCSFKNQEVYFSETTFMPHDNCYTDDKQYTNFEINTPSGNNRESSIIRIPYVGYTEGEISSKCNICDCLQEQFLMV